MDSKTNEVPDRACARTIDMPWMLAEEWQRRCQSKRQAPGREQARLIFLGDSITEAWPTVAPDHWQNFFGPYRPLCLGIGGDQTQHLLYRIESGELSQLPEARTLILLIGVNNLGYGGWSVEDTLRGLEAVQQAIRQALPQVEVLQCEILPAGEELTDPLREKISLTNQGLRKLGGERWQILDLSSVFLQKDGRIASEHMEDFLHPTREGYRLFAGALAKYLPSHIS